MFNLYLSYSLSLSHIFAFFPRKSVKVEHVDVIETFFLSKRVEFLLSVLELENNFSACSERKVICIFAQALDRFGLCVFRVPVNMEGELTNV